jgi:hypothetical protein
VNAVARQLVSMSEIMRVGPWSLRALGHPFGTAERATRLLTWTQAALGHGLDLLRIGETQLAASNRLPPSRRSGDGTAGRRIEAGGRNLFELGPPAVDLATCDVRLRGFGDVVVDDAIGALLVPSLADLAARRGLNALFVWRAAPGDIRLEGCPDDGWVACVQSPNGPAFFRGAPDRLADAAQRFAPDLRRRALRFVETGGPGKLGIFAGDMAGDGRAPALAAADFAERVAEAYRKGIEVPSEDLAHLYALERITWAPTSERSRKQAGY